jgi:hypothetical protein
LGLGHGGLDRTQVGTCAHWDTDHDLSAHRARLAGNEIPSKLHGPMGLTGGVGRRPGLGQMVVSSGEPSSRHLFGGDEVVDEGIALGQAVTKLLLLSRPVAGSLKTGPGREIGDLGLDGHNEG